MEILRRFILFDTFREKLVEDPRIPFYFFSIPGLDGSWGLFVPMYAHWRQIISLAVIAAFLQMLCAILNYQFIVTKRGSGVSYFFGWAVMIPLSCWIPFHIIEFYNLQNSSLKTISSIVPISVVFRTLEAMYNTPPPQVENSLMHYMIYYTAGSHHIWDKKTNTYAPPSLQHMALTSFKLIYYFFAVCLSLSFLLHYNFIPFPQSPVQLEDFHFGLEMLNPYHLANGYCFAVHTYFHLRLFFNILTFGENLKGFTTREPFRDPLWSSTSPTDFWNRRWNTVVHDILKGGAFLPARRYFSSTVSLVIVFISSGLLHEYTWSVTFYHDWKSRDEATGICSHCYSHTMLKLTLFFMWNGAIMLLERPMRNFPPFSWIGKLPVPIISTLVLATALPVSHWFVGDWIVGGFFKDWAPAFLLIKKL